MEKKELELVAKKYCIKTSSFDILHSYSYITFIRD